MTLVDEPTLERALRGAADAIDPPDGAAAQVLTRIRDLEARPTRWARWRQRFGGRTLVAAMAAVVALAGAVAVGVTARGGNGSRSTSAPASGAKASGPAALGTGGAEVAHGPAPTATANAGSAASPAGASGSGSVPPLPSGAVGQSAKVEETGSLSLTVGKARLEPTITALSNLAVANGGFVSGTQTQSGAGAPDMAAYGNVTLQIPEPSFASTVAEAQRLGTVTSITTKGTDVTGQYVDLQSRIAALQASRDQYLTIMTRASTISDILAVQSQLDDLQTQIEQLQGQLQVLDSETTYGTLSVAVTEPGGRPAPVVHPPSGLAGAWHGAVSGFAAAFDGLVRVAGPLLFVVLLLAALAALGRLAWRGVRRRAL